MGPNPGGTLFLNAEQFFRRSFANGFDEVADDWAKWRSKPVQDMREKLFYSGLSAMVIGCYPDANIGTRKKRFLRAIRLAKAYKVLDAVYSRCPSGSRQDAITFITELLAETLNYHTKNKYELIAVSKKATPDHASFVAAFPRKGVSFRNAKAVGTVFIRVDAMSDPSFLCIRKIPRTHCISATVTADQRVHRPPTPAGYVLAHRPASQSRRAPAAASHHDDQPVVPSRNL